MPYLKKLSLSKKDSEMMRFSNKLDQLAEGNDQRAIVNEQLFIRRRIDELQSEIFNWKTTYSLFQMLKATTRL